MPSVDVDVFRGLRASSVFRYSVALGASTAVQCRSPCQPTQV